MSGPTPSPRGSEIALWLASQSASGPPTWRVGEPMGDVSSRKYYRAIDPSGRSLVVAWYPPDAAATYQRYLTATRLLRAAEIRTPEIVAVDPEHRYMALEDVGDRRLFDIGPGPEAEGHYRRAVEIAGRIARLPRAAVAELNPPIDCALMQRELDATWELFLGPSLQPPLRGRVRAALSELCARIADTPLEPCHRDFMSRNLMVVGEGERSELVVIDHQDLREGPRGYDLASLFHDSCRLSPAQIDRLAPPSLDPGGLASSRLVVQRALKIVGTFHAFAARGAPTYLPMVPGALATALHHLARLPELEDLAAQLRESLGSPSEGPWNGA